MISGRKADDTPPWKISNFWPASAGLEAAWRQQVVLEGLALRCDPAHNLTVQLGDTVGVIPREECALGIREGTTRDIAILTCVGKAVSFVVTGFAKRRPTTLPALGTGTGAGAAAAMSAGGHLARHRHPPGTLRRLCGHRRGVPSLLPLKTLSISRIPHPNCRFRSGQEIFCVVRQVMPELGRVQLSHKELLGTWSENASHFEAGETVTGIIRSVMDYGIFVELAPNLTGLAEPLEGFQPGDSVSVYIKSILPDRQKIKLAIIGAVAPQPPAPLAYHATAGRVVDWNYHGVTHIVPPEEIIPSP